MPDQRKHRGPHPEDVQLFAETEVLSLQLACNDLSWLLSRGYASASSVKLVGDRYKLAARQRLAVSRCACSDSDRELRLSRRVSPAETKGKPIWLDGYNVLTSIEAALGGGAILHARDGCFRDMASSMAAIARSRKHCRRSECWGKYTQICRWASGLGS
ncbi:MAG: hypothetical protein CMJ78_20910 [Planctomycetaceae bacterium]|nr:hypothetical protein [Planctomycetaceae bacterium]